jgi:hypothetical protein
MTAFWTSPRGTSRQAGDCRPRLVQRLEPLLVQALVPELSVEALDVAVLHWPAGSIRMCLTPWLCAQGMNARLVNSGPLSVRTANG